MRNFTALFILSTSITSSGCASFRQEIAHRVVEQLQVNNLTTQNSFGNGVIEYNKWIGNCQYYEKRQNIWTGIGIGAAVLSGGAGIATLPASDNDYAKWSLAGVSLLSGVLSAVSTGLTKVYSGAFDYRHCKEVFDLRAQNIKDIIKRDAAAERHASDAPRQAPPSTPSTVNRE